MSSNIRTVTMKEFVEIVKDRVLARAKTKVKAGVRNETNELSCRYRLDEDANNTSPENCCFIGEGISPENYNTSFEGGVANVQAIFAAYCKSLGVIPEDTSIYYAKAFLKDLQFIHDDYDPEHWDMELEYFFDSYAY